MTKIAVTNIIRIIGVAALIAGAGFYLGARRERAATPATNANNMTINTPAFENNQYMHERYTCDGINVSPELHIGEVSKDAKSLVMIMDDPDAPMGTFTHWLVWNIDPKTRVIKEGGKSQGAVEGKNSAGRNGYAGPCPPSGVHHYRFKVYALSGIISPPQNIKQSELESLISGITLESAQLVGLYRRSSIPR